MDLRGTGCDNGNWIELAWDHVQWQALVLAVRDLVNFNCPVRVLLYLDPLLTQWLHWMTHFSCFSCNHVKLQKWTKPTRPKHQNFHLCNCQPSNENLRESRNTILLEDNWLFSRRPWILALFVFTSPVKEFALSAGPTSWCGMPHVAMTTEQWRLHSGWPTPSE